jgi:VCBS repeat-containing protein
MKKAVFLLIILLGIGIAISQINQTEMQKNQTQNSSFAIILKPYYFVNETFNFNVDPELNFTEFNILNGSLEIAARNISYDYILNLPPGMYYLAATGFYGGENYTNLTSFEVIEPEIQVYPENVYYNQSFFVLIRDYVGKFFEVIAYPKFSYNFTTLNETTTLEFSIDEPGNYTVFVNGKAFSIQVLSKTEEVEKELSISLTKNAFVMENVSITVNGTPNTEFSLEFIYQNVSVMHLVGVTDENGFYYKELYFENPGDYKVVFEYDGISINDTISVNQRVVNFTVDDLKDNYEDGNVSFSVIGPEMKDFSIHFFSENLTKVYFVRTNSKGMLRFEDHFDPGEYNLTLVYEGNVVFEHSFLVGLKKNDSFEMINHELSYGNVLGDDSYVELDGDAVGDDFVFLIKGRNVTIDCRGNKIISNNTGIIVEDSNIVRLVNCSLEGNRIGVLVKNSRNVRIEGLITFDNSNGIIAKNSSDLSVFDSDLTGVEFYGLLLFSSTGEAINSKIKTSTNVDVLYSLKN